MDLIKMKSGNQFPVLQTVTLLILATFFLSPSSAKPLTINKSLPSVGSSVIPKVDQSSGPSAIQEEIAAASSAERTKRQLFRDQIPQHRPLSGNLYAHHHGYPHPGRWHANPQQIVPANYNSGLHFDNPNVIITDDDFNRYGSTLQHIDDHRIRNNPAPIVHEYPTEYAKIVPLDQTQGHHSSQGHGLPPPLEVPIVATHHHIHHHQDGGSVTTAVDPYADRQQFGHVTHGHTVVHPGGNEYSVVHPDVNEYSVGPGPTVGTTYTEVVGGGGAYGHTGYGNPYSTISASPVKSSKPFFGFKLHQLFGHKMNFGGLKGLISGRTSIGHSLYKRRSNNENTGAVSWSSVQRKH